MKKEDLGFRKELLRKGVSYCVKEDCSVKGQCLHYLAFDNDKDFVEAYFINPRKVQGNAQCIKFLSNEVQKVGRGFRRALAQVPKGQITQIRSKMQRALGCCYANYYRYMRGDSGLSPKQAKVIQQVFETYGIASDEVFDAYEEVYVLD